MAKKITLDDVRNMKFDHPLDELEVMGLPAKGRRDRERKTLEEEGKKSNFPRQEPSRGERVMGEKTTPIKNPDRATALKKMKVVPRPRDITKEDIEHLRSKDYTSTFDFINLLVDTAMVARKLYKDEAKRLLIPQSESEEEEEEEEEPSNLDHSRSFPSPLDIPKKQRKKALINKAYQEKGKEKFSIPPRGGEEFFCCRTPEATVKRMMMEKSLKRPVVIDENEIRSESEEEEEEEETAKRRRMLMRENCFHSSSTSLDISKGERMMEKSLKRMAVIDENEKRFERKDKGIIINEEGASDEVFKNTRTKNSKVAWKDVNGRTYTSVDDYKLELPESIMAKIEGEKGLDVKLVIQKTLTPTDMTPSHNRITMPSSMMYKTDFLTLKELEYLFGKEVDGHTYNPIKVLLIEPNGDKNEGLLFRRWLMRKEKNKSNGSPIYVLNGNGKWKEVCKKHELVADMVVQVWSFRYDEGKLGFAMVIIGMADKTKGKRNGKRNRNRRNGSSESWSGNDSGTSGSNQSDDQAANYSN